MEESFEDGKPKVIRYYADGDTSKKIGETQFYETGKEKVKGDFDESQRDGSWTYWYPNGNKWSECEYKNGIKHGKSITYFENGNIRYEGKYKNDVRVGVWNFYDESGKLIREENMDEKK